MRPCTLGRRSVVLIQPQPEQHRSDPLEYAAFRSEGVLLRRLGY